MLVWGTADQPLIIADTSANLYNIHITADGASGAYVCWEKMNYTGGHYHTYLQHIDSNGTKIFGDQGMMLNISPDFSAGRSQICSDPEGVIVIWEDDSYGEGFSSQIVAQRYSTEGITQWGSASQVSTAGSINEVLKVISDGNDGALVVFSDSRNSNGNPTNYDLYAQHISNTGVRLWGNGGAGSKIILLSFSALLLA